MQLLSTPMADLEGRLYQIATSIDYTTSALDRLEDQRFDSETLSGALQKCETADTALHPLYLQQAKAARRRHRRNKCSRRLKQIVRSKASADNSTVTSMNIGGQLSYDRELWTKTCHEFGANRFADPHNTLEQQQSRYEHYATLAKNDMMDGKIFRLELWDVLQARAQLGSGAAGPDQIPPEILRAIPFGLLLHLHVLFRNYALLHPDVQASSFWKRIEFVGIPKETKLAQTFDKLRWLGLTSVLQK